MPLYFPVAAGKESDGEAGADGHQTRGELPEDPGDDGGRTEEGGRKSQVHKYNDHLSLSVCLSVFLSLDNGHQTRGEHPGNHR